MCAKIARQRADQLVFMQGLAESREQARRLIMAGKVALSSEGLPPGAPPQKVDKPGHPYPEGTVFELLGQERFVSRGAYKLLTILDNFKLDVSGMVCLDAGASTGGFTDCLLQHGATRVYAVDVGKNQLHEKLRADERVINLEGVNLRAAAPELIPEPVDLVVADVSFISLTLILPPCMTWLKPGGLAAVLPMLTAMGLSLPRRARASYSSCEAAAPPPGESTRTSTPLTPGMRPSLSIQRSWASMSMMGPVTRTRAMRSLPRPVAWETMKAAMPPSSRISRPQKITG